MSVLFELVLQWSVLQILYVTVQKPTCFISYRSILTWHLIETELRPVSIQAKAFIL